MFTILKINGREIFLNFRNESFHNCKIVCEIDKNSTEFRGSKMNLMKTIFRKEKIVGKGMNHN